MKMKFLTLVLSGICLSGYGQDYLVTNNGDTLRGELKPQYYDQLDQVQVLEKKKKTTFTARQVMIYSFKGDLYRPIQRENTIRFMKILKSGYLSLYAFRVENMSTYDGRLLAKLDGTSLEVPNLGFKKLMSNYLADCAALKDKIMKGDYSKKDLITVIDDYNACMANKSQPVKKEDALSTQANEEVVQLETFKKTVDNLNNFAAKQDALDLVNDLIAKVKSGKPVSNYQIQALKGFFKDNEAVRDELEKLLSRLRVN